MCGWFERLSHFLHSLGFKNSKVDSFLLICHRNGHECYVLVYVDDIIITGSSSVAIDQLIQALNQKFSLKDLGKLSFFLGVEVSHTSDNDMFLSQRKYISDLLHTTHMHEARGISTAMVSGAVRSTFHGEKFHDVKLYRSTVGALQYVTLTRPEITYSVNKVCQFMHSPTNFHCQAVKRILRYLGGTLDYDMIFRKSLDLSLQDFADSNWTSDLDDRKSTSGSCVYFGGNLIQWASKKQSIISRSSTEDEYRSLAHVSAELVWLRSLFQDLNICLSRLPIV